jgi:hypothetical protein
MVLFALSKFLYFYQIYISHLGLFFLWIGVSVCFHLSSCCEKRKVFTSDSLHVGYLQALNGGMAKCKNHSQDVSSINVAQTTEFVLELPFFFGGDSSALLWKSVREL